jgi:hypothetical protein
VHVYHERLAARQLEHHRLAGIDARVAYARLTAVAVAILVLILSLGFAMLSLWWVCAPIVAFLAFAVWHDRVLHAKATAASACLFYERGLARLEDRWTGTGSQGQRFADESHPYANDLDLFGSGSLFELLSLARTQIGESTLAQWLKAPAPAEDIRLRQQAVAELRPQLDFREAMATAGTEVGELDTVALSGWMARTPPSIGPLAQAAALVLAAGIIATAWWWAVGGPMTPLLMVLVVKATFTRAYRSRVSVVLQGVEGPIRQLDILSSALAQIEQLPVESLRLNALRSALMTGGEPSSRAIARLHRLADMLDWQRNAFFAPIGATFSWPLHVAALMGRWRRRFASRVPAWLSALGEYEALNSIAAYSFEHPSDGFPILLDQTASAAFDGRQLGHPLVPAAQMVRNDVRLPPDVRLLIISGSNMSGKSTLLRTVGVNVVMAMAGAPVRAERLELTPLAVGATLHIQDSLQSGRSRFFTEITRVRQIADLAGRQPQLLFLLDELFQGTNSHDRKVGAAAVLRTLVARGAIGLITTHDLALTSIAGELDGRALNVHFQDEFRGDEMVFDYRMHPGPVAHSNALALMRAVGLSVADEQPSADRRGYE